MPRYTSPERLHRIAEQNDLFLRHLRQTGNATISAKLAGVDRTTIAARSRKDEDFKQAWETALVFARAALARKGGAAPVQDGGLVAAGGEYMIGANLHRGIQVRRARAGHVTARGERAFLAALAATANIQLAAEAIGVDPRAFYKRRAQSAEFAAAMQDALAAGYEAVEFALLKTALQTLAPEDACADIDPREAGAPEPLARMTMDQALALIGQRHKTMAIGARHVRGTMRPRATPEETDAKLIKLLDVVARRTAREKAQEDAGNKASGKTQAARDPAR